MERFMRQHSYMSGLSSACPLPLLAQCKTHHINATFKMNQLLDKKVIRWPVFLLTLFFW